MLCDTSAGPDHLLLSWMLTVEMREQNLLEFPQKANLILYN